MTSVNLLLRPSSKPGRYEGSLSIRLIHNRRAKTIVLKGCRLYPEEWDKERQAIVYNQEDPARNEYLESLELKIKHELAVFDHYLLNLQKRGRYTVDDVMELYRCRKSSGKLQGYVEKLASGMEREGCERTAEAYRTVVRGIIRFNKGVDIPLNHINNNLIRRFEIYLKEKGRMPNTISFYMRNLRAIYNKAVMDKYVTNRNENPFAGVYGGVTRTMKRSLSAKEVNSFCAIDFQQLLAKETFNSQQYNYIKSLQLAHSYFVFCFYARGMCFVDLAYLEKKSVSGGFLCYIRKKTGRQIEIKITPEMQTIIDGYSAQVKNSPYLFPIINTSGGNCRLQYETALRTQNHRLKKLAALVGIKKRISTHWARHSWATIGKQKNVPLRVISECLGHTSEKTTLIYLGSLENSVLDAANDLILSSVLRPGASKGEGG